MRGISVFELVDGFVRWLLKKYISLLEAFGKDFAVYRPTGFPFAVVDESVAMRENEVFSRIQSVTREGKGVLGRAPRMRTERIITREVRYGTVWSFKLILSDEMNKQYIHSGHGLYLNGKNECGNYECDIEGAGRGDLKQKLDAFMALNMERAFDQVGWQDYDGLEIDVSECERLIFITCCVPWNDYGSKEEMMNDAKEKILGSDKFLDTVVWCMHVVNGV